MIAAGGLRRVTSRHCGDPKCWCASKTVIVYGNKMVRGREVAYLVQEVEGEGCWLVGTDFITRHTRSTAPSRWERLGGVDTY